jgi:hypothetical protein
MVAVEIVASTTCFELKHPIGDSPSRTGTGFEAFSNNHHNFASSVPFLEVAHGLRQFVQLAATIDNRRDLSDRDQFAYGDQICLIHLREN